jgi:pimeloyl-ACP methyl ester carboxylesterase/DNA-binding CsgD family transcriptional regulator
MTLDQEIRFCTTKDGVRIAYAVAGNGPPLVKSPNWLTHLEYEVRNPVWKHWWEELARDFTVIRFDQRGCGLSQWDVENLTFDGRVLDLEAVIEATELESFVLLGISQGAGVAIDYTVRHPERVTRLILSGGFARGRRERGMSREVNDAHITLIREGWGKDTPAYRRMFTSTFMPDASTEQMDWFDELQRVSTSPENAARLYAGSSQVNVMDRLGQVKVPTLVVHARGDQRVDFEEGRMMASLIPGALFLPLDSRNHLTLAEEPAWETLVGNVRQFIATGELLTEQRQPAEPRADISQLTPREVEVLKLIAAGKSNQEIANELVISINTVTNHVKNILGKTQSANRTEAANFAHQHGLTSAGR